MVRDQAVGAVRLVQTRKASIGNITKDERRVALTFSSEEPVTRSDYVEILSHADGAVNLERLASGRANALMNHDPHRWVGVIESAWIENKRGRAVVRFGHSTLAADAFTDVCSGVLTSVSVGYTVFSGDTVGRAPNGLPYFVATHWMPFEISIVAIPADVTVGVGRQAAARFSVGILHQHIAREPAKDPWGSWHAQERQRSMRNSGRAGGHYG